MVDDELDRKKNAEADGIEEGSMDEPYDPFADRPEGRALTSDIAVFLHLLKNSIGTGILFLPNAFRRTGYVMSIICSILMGIVATHTAVVLVHCAQALCRRKRIPMLDFAKTAELSVSIGPPGFRKYGKHFAILTNMIICFVQFQTSVIYILYVADSFQQVINFFANIKMDVRVYIVIFLPFNCILALVPNLKYLAPFSAIGSFFVCLGICIALYYFLEDFSDPGRLKPFTTVMPVPMYCTIFLFALHNMTIYLPLENTMKNPNRMPFIMILSMFLNICIYAVFGFLGYNKYTESCDSVIRNLPIEETLAEVVKIAIALSVLFTFGIVYYVLVSVTWPMVQQKIRRARYYHEILFRLIGVLVITTLAIAIPRMVPLLGLLSSLSMSTIMLFVPIVIETTCKWERVTRLLLLKNFIILLLWILILVIGAIESVWSIVREYSGRDNDC